MTDVDERPVVLAVDDDEDSLLLVNIVLTSSGYDVQTAAGGAEAEAAMRRSAPDAVVMDLRMPGRSGFDVIAQMRADSLRPPVVVCSASVTDRDRRQAAALGAVAFVAKPFTHEELASAVDYALRLGRACA